MTNLEARRAGAGDAAGIAACVRAAYSPCIERIGYVEVEPRTERGFARVYMRKRPRAR